MILIVPTSTTLRWIRKYPDLIPGYTTCEACGTEIRTTIPVIIDEAEAAIASLPCVCGTRILSNSVPAKLGDVMRAVEFGRELEELGEVADDI